MGNDADEAPETLPGRYSGVVMLPTLGNCRAVKASRLRIGDKIVWNHGYISEIVSIDPDEDNFIIFGIVQATPGHRQYGRRKSDRRVKDTTLVPVYRFMGSDTHATVEAPVKASGDGHA